jgi:Leucine-rich repeat (LRR) protein
LPALIFSAFSCSDKSNSSPAPEGSVSDESIPTLIECYACKKSVSKKSTECTGCGHPTKDSIVAFKVKAQEKSERIQFNLRKVLPNSDFYFQNPKNFGGNETLYKICKAKRDGWTELDLRGCEISDISPIKSLIGLRKLNLSYYLGQAKNKIVNLSPLQDLINLEDLDIGGNKVTDLSPLSKLKMLKHLRIGSNPVSSLEPLSPLVNLEELSFFSYYNHDTKAKVSDITPLATLANLTVLELRGNRITDIMALSKLKNLRMLRLDGNLIKDLRPLEDLLNLESLHLYDNKISEVNSLLELKNLRNLSLFQNPIPKTQRALLEDSLNQTEISWD